MERDKADMVFKDISPTNLQAIFSGQLNLNTVADLWQRCLDKQKQSSPDILTVDLKSISYCDGAGVALLLELERRQLQANKKFHLQGVSPQIKKLLAMIAKQPEKAKEHVFELQNTLVNVGRFTANIWKTLHENVIFIGMLTQYLWKALLFPKDVCWKDFWKTLEEVGPNALPIIILVGFLVGLISAFQSAIPLGQFGAQIYIADLVGIGLTREMGPLMTAVLLAGRTASAFAAELGTMKINQEVDALTTMGLEPVKFLTIPRVLAAVLMTPLLNVFLIFFGLIGCGIVMHGLGFSLDIYLDELYHAISFGDFMSGLVKTFAFGIVIASIGCLHGLKTRLGASAVGYSTTQAVVSSVIMIVIVDGIFACIYYVLGI